MNKKTKLLLAVLSASCLTAAAFGFASCGKEPAAQNDEYRQAYALYTAYAESQGDVPASYEDWLASIKGEKGDKGDKGDQGEKGEKGDKGDQGKSIASMQISSDGMSLEITYTDGSSDSIPLDVEEAEHKYGEIVVVAEPTESNDGFGYKACSDADCNSVEYVKYHKINVTDLDHNSIDIEEEGVYTVKIPVSKGDDGFSGIGVFLNFDSYYCAYNYSVKVSDSNVGLTDSYSKDFANSSFVLNGESKTLTLGVAASALTAEGYYTVRVEVEKTYVEEGGSKELPVQMQLNEIVQRFTNPDEWVYFSYSGNDGIKPDSGIFKFGKNVEMQLVGSYAKDKGSLVYTDSLKNIKSGTAVDFPSEYESVIVRARAVDGLIYFSSEYKQASYTITLKAPADSDVSLSGIKVSFSVNGEQVGSAKSDADGIVNVNLPDLAYTVSIEGVDGYVGAISLAKGTYAADLNLESPDASVSGGSQARNAVDIDLGSTQITNSGWVKFTAETAATYTFSMKYSYFATIYASGEYGDSMMVNYAEVPVTDSNGNTISFKVALAKDEYIKIKNAQVGDVVVVEKVEGSEVEPEDPSDENKLIVGDNEISIGVDEYECAETIKLTFVAEEAGYYMISTESENALVGGDSFFNNQYIYNDEYLGKALSYTFYLEQNGSIDFYFSTMDYAADVYSVKIKKNEAPVEETPVTVLSFGDNLVAASMDGEFLIFTAEEDGTYMISSEDLNAFIGYETDNGISWEIPQDGFELKAGESITFVFSTQNLSDDTYVVTISNASAK